MREPYQYLEQQDARVYDYASPFCAKIDAMESWLRSLPQANQVVVMRFAPGMVSRECFTEPSYEEGKEIIATSRIHRTDHFWFLHMGRVAILNEQTGAWDVLNGPQTAITKKGTRRVIKILEPSLVTTVHANPDNITDLDELDRMLYEPALGPERHAARIK